MSVEREAGWPTQRLRPCFRSHSGCRVKKNIGKLVREVAILYSQAPLHQTAGRVSETRPSLREWVWQGLYRVSVEGVLVLETQAKILGRTTKNQGAL